MIHPNQYLKSMIEIYDNDFLLYEDDDKESVRLIFLELILQVTRYVNDFRYCKNPKCPCSPEETIRGLLKRHEDDVMTKMFGGTLGLTDIPMPKIREFLNDFKEE
jgi:hypothetical protein